MKLQQFDSKFSPLLKNSCIAVLVLGTAIFFSACKDKISTIQAFSSPEDLPTQEAINFETLYTDSGQVRFFLKTPKLLRFENDGKAYTEFPVGMQLIKYDADQKVISSITADYAKQFIKEKKWEAKNNVVVLNADGDSLKTEHLIWEEKTGKIYTEEFVKIISKNETFTGVGLVSDQDMQNWELLKPSGVMYIDVDNSQPSQQPSNTIDTSAQKNKTRQPAKQTLQFK